MVFSKTANQGYIQFNSVTKRKFFFNLEEHEFFSVKETVEDPNFWVLTPNPRYYMDKYKKGKSEVQRLAQNYPIQGTSADITKYACILFFKEILKRKWWKIVKIVNIVHDEILVECPNDMKDEVSQILIDSMKAAAKPFCPVLEMNATFEVGNHWVH